MLRRIFPPILLLPLIAALLFAAPLRADPALTERLARALDFDRLVAVLHREGLKYGRDLEDELFAGSGGPRWAAIVASVHDQTRMRRILTERLSSDLEAKAALVPEMAAFFEGDPGARIVALELSAREALLEDAVRDAAEISHDDMAAAKDPRLDLIRRFADVNDLVEMNVAGGLNANLAFYRGMIAGGAVDPSLAESEIMSDLWSQEPQIRQDTEDWLFPYLAMAYQPLGDADLHAYIAFSTTPAGRALNTALFAAFDALFVTISEELGFAAARFAGSEDL